MRGRVSIDRLVRISQEIRVGRAFQEEGTVLFGQNLLRDGDESETLFCKGNSPNEPPCLSHHLKVGTGVV